jgi:hydrogenase maturation protease
MAVVIGVGSPFGFDRLGWLVIDRLRRDHDRDYWQQAGVGLHSADRPGAALLDHWQGASLALVVDAVQGDRPAGAVLRLERDEIAEQGRALGLTSSHGFGVAEAVALGSALGRLPERLVLLGMAAGTDDQRQPDEGDVARLSAAVMAELAAVGA